MSHETELLLTSVSRFLNEQWPLEQAGSLAQSADARRRLWTALAEQGLTQLGQPEVDGLAGAQPFVRTLGAAHAPAPLPESIALGFVADQVRAEWAEALREGPVLPALCCGVLDDGPSACTLRLNEGALFGRADMVDALGASHLAAITALEGDSEQFALVWVSLAAAGVHSQPQSTYGEVGGWLQLDFDGAPAQVTPLSRAQAEDTVLLWRLLLAVRATGALQRAQTALVAYVQQRKQFGVAIGSFQAIQHKLTDIQIALDGAVLTQQVAATAFDAGHAGWRFDANSAIAAADPSLRKAMLEVHHAFGAIGYSEEHEVPRHFRRIHLDLARAKGGAARRALANTLAAQPSTAFPEQDLGPAAESFRTEVRSWLDQHWTETQRAQHAQLPIEHQGTDKDFSRALGAAGWIALTWPQNHGGQTRTRREQLALIQECTRAKAPCTAHIAAATLIAPALLAFGSPEQKAEFLPRIARGELTICLGYSESEAGSDLASLRTRAVRDGDDWIITGQKMWGTTTDKADYAWLAARTDPDAAKHAGISVFLLPMNLPGISVQPSKALYGKTFSTQFYDQVRVPASALVGGLHQGWKVITGALVDERILLGGSVTQIALALGDLVGLLRAQQRLDALALDRIGALAADLAVARALLMRSVLLTEQGQAAHVEAAMTKTYSGELMERFAEAALDLVGPGAALSAGTPGAALDGELERLLRTAPMQVIGGGANEIQRTLIAQRGLGLPR